MADVKSNIGVIERLEDLYHRREYDELADLVRSDLHAHTPGSDQIAQDTQGLIANNENAHSAFPDRKTEILDIFGEGDRVVARIRQTGTNTGGLPWFGVPANGAKVDFEWVQISRHDDDGKVAETWAQIEIPKLMMQLGAMPAPEGNSGGM
jgi:predicted ester cyclase